MTCRTLTNTGFFAGHIKAQKRGEICVEITLTVLISMLAALLGIFFGYKSYERSQRGEDQDRGKQSGIVLTEIGYIKSGIDDIKREQREQANTNTEMFAKIAKVETLAKQAHHRIDRLDDRSKLNSQSA